MDILFVARGHKMHFVNDYLVTVPLAKLRVLFKSSDKTSI